jgi:hypothetical protein
MALFGTIACISCSSYIFWAAAAKDHILSTTVLAFIIFFYIRYLSYGRMKDAFLAFVCSGLLIWVRPEIGFFVTIFSGLFFSVPRIRNYFRKETSLHQCLQSLLPAAGVFLGSIPFFVNNLLISHNPLIPVFDLPRSIQQSGSAITLPLSWDQVMITPAAVNEVSPLDLPATVSRLWDMVSHAMLSGFTVDNLGQGFIGLMTFPKNDSIGFFIMCPLFFIALIALLLWYTKILDLKKERKTLLFFLVIMGAAVFFSYATKFSSMNTSHGIIPDMRYLSPAYIPAGLISVLILSRTPVLKNYDELVKTSITGSVILAPLLILVMIVVHPFSDSNAGYFSFFEFIILCELVLCSLVMILFRFYRNGSRFLLPMLPCLIVLVIITAFSFQFMLTSFYSMVEKFNGYPFWIPLIREGFNMLITVNYLPPV